MSGIWTDKMSTPTHIWNLPYEVLCRILRFADLDTKKNCRLARNYWRLILDHYLVKFNVYTWDHLKFHHSIQTIANSLQYFNQVKISFIWEELCPTLPFPIVNESGEVLPKIGKLILEGYHRLDGDTSISIEGSEAIIAKIDDIPKFRKLLLYILKYACRQAEYLKIKLLGLVGISIEEIESCLSLSNNTWNRVRKVRFHVQSGLRRTCRPVYGIMKFAKLPALSDFEILIQDTENTSDNSSEKIAFIMNMCNFFLRHKETLRSVNCEISVYVEISNFSDKISFLRGQLKLEHCQIQMGYYYDVHVNPSRAYPDFRFLAFALTYGSHSLHSFELIAECDFDNYVEDEEDDDNEDEDVVVEENEEDDDNEDEDVVVDENEDDDGDGVNEDEDFVVEENDDDDEEDDNDGVDDDLLYQRSVPLNEKADEDLQILLMENGPTLETLKLSLNVINLNDLQHCTRLKSLEFGFFETLNESKEPLHLETVTEFSLSYAELNGKLAHWLITETPNLILIKLQQCKIEPDVLELLMNLPILREVKMMSTTCPRGLKAYCIASKELTYKEYDVIPKNEKYIPGPYNLEYFVSILINRNTRK